MGIAKSRKFWVALISLFAVVAVVAAGGSETKGKFYFKKNCKTCHAKGQPGGEVTPLTKTQEQWKAYFTAGKHNKSTEVLSKYLTPDQIVDVQTFVTAHASDSPQPETCGS